MPEPLVHMNGWDYLPNNLAAGDANLIAFLAADSCYTLNALSTTPGAFGGTALKLNTNGTFYQMVGRELLGGAVLGFRYYVGPLGQSNIFSLYDSTVSLDRIYVNFLPNGGVTATVQGITYNTPAATYLISTWFYVQIKWVAGSFTLYINGDIAIQVTSSTIVPPQFDSMKFTCNGFQPVGIIDDLYLLDPLIDGGANTLGNVRVLTQAATAAGDSTQLVPMGVTFNWQAALNWQLINTQYDATPTVGNFDLYQMAASVAARQVFGIQVKGGYTQDNGTQLYGKNQIKTGGTVYGGTQHGCNSLSYKIQNDYWSKNPGTGAAWTTALLNVLQAGPLLAASD